MDDRDLEVIKNSKGLFFSHRPGVFDRYTVNETSTDLPTEEENKDDCLRWASGEWVMRRKEVMEVNRDFVMQTMTGEATQGKFPSPFEGEVGVAREWDDRRFRVCIATASSRWAMGR